MSRDDDKTKDQRSKYARDATRGEGERLTE